MTEAGLIEGRTDEPAETVASARPAAELAPDPRADNERCAICIGPLHPRRKTRVAEGQWAHRICATLPQEGEWVIPHWLATPIEVRRRRIIMHYGVDPFACTQMATEVEWLTMPTDVDGLPIRMDVERTRGRVLTVGVPNCYWRWARERGDRPLR